jgi:hypothetical protein
MSTILKALKKQAGKPFRVVEPTGLVPGWDHYSYKRDPDLVLALPVELCEAPTEQCVDQHVDQYIDSPQELESVKDTDQHIAESITSEIMCEPPKEENTVDLAACMADGFQKVVEAVQSIKIETPTFVPPTPLPSLLEHSMKPETTRLKKHRVKVLNRDREGNIETIDLQEY